MKNYLFAASRLVFGVEAPDGSNDSAKSEKIDFSSGNEIVAPTLSKKEQIRNMKRGLDSASAVLKKVRFLKDYARKFDELSAQLGRNESLEAVSKKAAQVAREAKESFIKGYKAELIKKNPQLALLIGPAFDAAVAPISSQIDGLIDAVANGRAEDTYDNITALVEGLSDMADNMSSAAEMIDLPMPIGITLPDPYKTY